MVSKGKTGSRAQEGDGPWCILQGTVHSTGTKVVMGLDLSDKSARFCCLSADGEISNEGKVRLTVHGLRSVLERQDPVRLVLEVGTHRIVEFAK